MLNIVSFIYAFFLLSIFAGVVVLQVFLSRRKNKFLGLIIPIVQFFFSVIITSISVFVVGSLTSSYSAETIISTTSDFSMNSTLSLLVVFVLLNIPTIVSLVIYFINRKKVNRKNGLD